MACCFAKPAPAAAAFPREKPLQPTADRRRNSWRSEYISRFKAQLCLTQRVLGHKHRDPWPIPYKLNALPLICESARKIKSGPTVARTFVDRARRTASTLVVWNSHRYRSARRSDEHVRLDGVRTAQVICSVHAPLGCLKGLPRAVGLDVAASILDRDCALPHYVVDEPGMVVPCACSLADRRLQRPGCQRRWTFPQSYVVARADPKFSGIAA